MELMVAKANVSLARLLLASMAAVENRRVFALYDPSQSRASDGKWGSGGFGGPKTSTGKAKGSLIRRVRAKDRQKAIAKPKEAWQKAKEAHAAAPSPKTESKLAKAAARLKEARKDAALDHGARADVRRLPRSGSAADRAAAAQEDKSEYQRSKAEHVKSGSKVAADRVAVAHAKLTEARSGAKPVDSSTWGERANFNEVLKSPARDPEFESQVVDDLMARHVKSRDPAGARQVAREHVRSRTSTDAIAKHYGDVDDKSYVRQSIDEDLDRTRQRLRDHARSSAGRTLADQEYRLAKAEAYARLEAVHQTRREQKKKRNA